MARRYTLHTHTHRRETSTTYQFVYRLFFAENLNEAKLSNGHSGSHNLINGNAKPNHIASSGINEKSGLLNPLTLSSLVMDISTLDTTFQSHIKRKYCYGEL